VIQRGEQPRIAFEARQPFSICRKETRQDFDRNVATEFGVARAVHLAHAARPQDLEDVIGANPSAAPQESDGRLSGWTYRRMLKRVARGLISVEQRTDFSLQRRVVSARFSKKWLARIRRQLQR
jgi:hypothetical protein